MQGESLGKCKDFRTDLSEKERAGMSEEEGKKWETKRRKNIRERAVEVGELVPELVRPHDLKYIESENLVLG